MVTYIKGGRQTERTVGNNKTLLVDGPASVVVTSGKVEVFGQLIGSSNKVVIREGKRLPFTVNEKAVFNISLGESANVEEVDGNTIPESWATSFEELMKIQAKPVTAIVMGTVDSGKTSFCTYLVNRLLREKKKTAILDGDLGQSDIGPACTVAYAVVTKPLTDLFSLEAKNAFFIGATSPSMFTNKAIEDLASLKKEVSGKDLDFIVANTDGWVQGEDAINYKVQLIEKLDPNIVFCIQQKDELAPLLSAIKKFSTFVVDSPPTIKQRSREERKGLRELGYQKYLRNAKVQSFSLNWLKLEENELFGSNETHENTMKARKIYEFLRMKPLHLAESQDKISVVIGRNRWIDEDQIRKVEDLTKKKMIVTRKGEEENLLVALYNAERKFLGIGVLREIDYKRKTLKILTPVSKEIAIVIFGKVKLDKNLKETPTSPEESQPNCQIIDKP